MEVLEIDSLIKVVTRIVAEETQLKEEQIDVDKHLGTFGLDSINSIYLLERLENEFKVELNPLMFYDYPTIRSFSSHIHSIINK